ncbi:MAG: thiamine phosphate synthase [Gemmatimonadales bacterium]
MRPLPRVHAVTDAAVLALEDLGVRAAAIAAAGPAVALHARDRNAGGAALTAVTTRFLSLARPPEAAVFVNGHPDIAQGLGAQGVQLSTTDLAPEDARRVFPKGWIGCSVHSLEQAEKVAPHADLLFVGTIYPTPTHPDREAAGPGLVESIARLGVPVIAIGGVNVDRLTELRDAGAWGVAAIRALWYAPDPAAAAMAFAEPWMDRDV